MKFFKLQFLLAALFLFVGVSLSFASRGFYEGEIPKGIYYIQSAKEFGKTWKGCWDVPGKPAKFKKGQNIKVWEITQQDSTRKDRLYYFRKVQGNQFEIGSRLAPAHNNRVDVAGGRTTNGTNVGLWEKNNSSAQRFRLKYMGSGRWKIYTLSGQILCLKGRSSENGSNVHIWKDHNGASCEWVFINKRERRAFYPPKKINTELRHACKRINGNAADRYFSKVGKIQLKKDNKKDSIRHIVSSMGNKIPAAIQNIVFAVRNNRNAAVRHIVYRELAHVDFSGMENNFASRLERTMVRKSIEDEISREKNIKARKFLEKLARNL